MSIGVSLDVLSDAILVLLALTLGDDLRELLFNIKFWVSFKEAGMKVKIT